MAQIINYPRGTSTRITLKSSSADLKPFFGGPTQRIMRLADKWCVEVTMRSMTPALAGDIVNALMKGLSETLTVPVKDALDTSDLSDSATVAQAVTGGTSLQFANAGGTPIVGQFVSVIDGSNRRYLHRVDAVSGGTLTVFPALKASLQVGDTIEFANPRIEGWIEGQEQSYTVGLVSNVGCQFKVNEAR